VTLQLAAVALQAYTLAPHAEHIAVLRIVVREGLSRDLAEKLADDIVTVCEKLQRETTTAVQRLGVLGKAETAAAGGGTTAAAAAATATATAAGVEAGGAVEAGGGGEEVHRIGSSGLWMVGAAASHWRRSRGHVRC